MSDLQQKIDRHVTIEGVARNASAGAIVMTDDRTPVYLDGIESWDRATDGKKVSATGTLRQRAGQQLVNARGEVSHGFPDARFVLEQPKWTVS